MSSKVAHPMVKLQHKLLSLVDSKVLKPSDKIWKVAFLYGDKWEYWKKELQDFGFSTQDPISEILVVEEWDED